jgi:hypothetical protein
MQPRSPNTLLQLTFRRRVLWLPWKTCFQLPQAAEFSAVRFQMSTFPKDKLVAAAYVFESANGNTLPPDELSHVNAAEVQNADPAHLANGIRGALEAASPPEAGYRAIAFWALGKRFDPSLRDFFRRHLAAEVNRDAQVAYQIMIALDNLDEPVWPAEQSSRSSAEDERNRAAALRYVPDSKS